MQTLTYLTVNKQAFIFNGILTSTTAVSLYLLDRNQYKVPPLVPSFPAKNPYKGTRKLKDEESIPSETKQQYVDKILNFVLYDAEDCQALRNFEPVMSNTHCIFAKKSVIWGARDYDRKLTVGELGVFLKSS